MIWELQLNPYRGISPELAAVIAVDKRMMGMNARLDHIENDMPLFDKAQRKGQSCFIFGRRSTGRMNIRLLDETKVNASVSYKNLKLVETRKNMLTELRKAG